MSLSPRALLCIPLLLLASAEAGAQTCSATLQLGNVPASASNTRFYSDLYSTKRPSFTLNGFSCSGTSCNNGYGLKQVLEQVYRSSPDRSVQEPFEALLRIAADSAAYTPDPAPTDRGAIGENAVVLQARAFVALVTYLLERNGNSISALNGCTEFDLPSHSTALTRFKTVLLDTDAWRLTDEGILDTWLWTTGFGEAGFLPRPGEFQGPDAYKWTSILPNVTRALDLYLALENAYNHYGDADYANQNATRLLSRSQKQTALSAFNGNIDRLEVMGGESVFLEGIHGVDAYDVQAGNWPLEVQTSIGYAILGTQNPSSSQQANFASWATRAFKATGKSCSDDRSCYWSYMSKRKAFWAEGPYYFELMMDLVVPFWHAARTNGFLSNTALVGYTAGDPFRSSWFLNPLRWLADIATPDGRTPPLDDANKRRMTSASLLRWQSQYGDATLGRKFAAIGDAFIEVGAGTAVDPFSGFAAANNVLTVELAIPRVAEGGGTALPATYGNTSASTPTEDSPAPLIVRRQQGGRTHYVLLNGESGAPLTRGEGHEQGDQLQLLYYVDGVSYLSDSGYDAGSPESNSTWNHYYDHNAPLVFPIGNTLPNDGGIYAPGTSITPLPPRKTSARMRPMEQLYRANVGAIDVLTGRVKLETFTISGTSLHHVADARRKVLFIPDPNRPYLIDLNWICHDPASMGDPAWGYKLETRYHVNTATAPTTWTYTDGQGRQAQGWIYRNLYGDRDANDALPATSTSLLIQPYRVELPLRAVNVADTGIEQFKRDQSSGDPIQRLAIMSEDTRVSNETWLYDDWQFITTVALVEAFPTTASPQGNQLTSLAVVLEPADPAVQNLNNKRVYSWKRDANTIDVLAVRSSMVHTQRHAAQRAAFAVQVPDAGNLELTLSTGHDYGFARIRRNASTGQFEVDASYVIGFTYVRPLVAVAVTGPGTYIPGVSTTWSNQKVGGVSPYDYVWQYQYECSSPPPPPPCTGTICTASGSTVLMGPTCGVWNDGGTASTFTANLSGSAPAAIIKVTVTDATSTTRSGALRVTPGDGTWSSGGTSLEDPLAASTLRAEEAVPKAYALHAVRPNPFAGAAELRYDLPEPARVRLTLYDVLGREVAVLVDDEEAAGVRSVQLDGGSLPAGVYLVRLEARGATGPFVQTQRVTVLR